VTADLDHVDHMVGAVEGAAAVEMINADNAATFEEAA
jgi:hypothetical protein